MGTPTGLIEMNHIGLSEIIEAKIIVQNISVRDIINISDCPQLFEGIKQY